MKKIIWQLMLCMALIVGNGASVADDESRFPPITPENRGQASMIQVLSNGGVRDLAWSPDSQQLAVSARGGTWIYDINLPNTPNHYIKEQTLSSKVIYSPKGDIYISYTPFDYCPMGICEDGQATYVYDANTHELLTDLHLGVSEIVFFRDGDYVAVSSFDYGILIWRTDSFKENIGKHPSDFYHCQILTPAEAGGMTFSPDENLVTYSVWRTQNISPGDKSIQFWDTKTCLVHFAVTTFTADDSMSFPPYTARLSAYSPDGRYAIIPFFSDIARQHYLYLWDVPAVRDLGKLPDEILEEHIWGFTPDSQHLLLYDKDTSLAKIWHIASQTTVRAFYADSITRLDATSLLMRRAGDLYRITETTETLLWDDESHVKSVIPTDNRQALIIQHDNNKTVLLDITSQTIIHEWSYSVNPKITPDKSKMVWVEDNTIQVWDFARAEQTQLQNFMNTGRNTVWSATENTMVTLNDSDNITRFEVWTLTETGFEYRWNTERSTDILEVGDDYIVTSDSEGVHFWDVPTGALVAQVSSDCDPSDSFCARWLAIQAREAQPEDPITIAPPFMRNGNQFTLNYDDQSVTYTVPDHIMTFVDSPSYSRLSNSIKWYIIPNGDVLMSVKGMVYNVTQDTAMQMGYVEQIGCDDGCYPFEFTKVWVSRDGKLLFGDAWAEDNNSNTINSVITAWDIETGKLHYNVHGTWNDNVYMSQDEQFVFSFGVEFYFGMGKTYYNRNGGVYDAHTGEVILGFDTYGMNAERVEVSPLRRFVVVHSDINRIWAVVNHDDN